MTQEASPNQQYKNLSMFRVSVPRRARYMTQLNPLELLAALSARNEWSFYV